MDCDNGNLEKDLSSNSKEFDEDEMESLFPDDSGLDGNHWTIVDMKCSRFQRLIQRKKRSIIATPSSIKAINEQEEKENKKSEVQVINLEESTPQPLQKPIQINNHQINNHHKQHKRKRRRIDDVTEEENKEMDGEYWLIDASSERLQRRLRRKSEYAYNAEDLGAELEFISPKTQKQNQVDEIMSDLRKKLIKKSQTQFDAVITLIKNSGDNVPLFLRVYHKRYRYLQQLKGLTGIIHSKPKHIAFSPEVNINKELSKEDKKHWKKSMKSLELARLNIKEISTLSDDDIIISSDDEDEEIGDNDDFIDRNYDTYVPDRKRRKISNDSYQSIRFLPKNTKSSLHQNPIKRSRKNSAPKRKSTNTNVMPMSLPSTMSKNDYLQTLQIPIAKKQNVNKKKQEKEIIIPHNNKHDNNFHFFTQGEKQKTKKTIEIYHDYSTQQPKGNEQQKQSESIILHLPPLKYEKNHLFIFPRQLYYFKHKNQDQNNLFSLNTANSQFNFQIKFEFNYFVENIQKSFTKINIKLDELSTIQSNLFECIHCNTKEKTKEINEIISIIEQECNEIQYIYALFQNENQWKDEILFQTQCKGVLMFELLKIWKKTIILQNPIFKILLNIQNHCNSMKNNSNNKLLDFFIWIRIYFCSFFTILVDNNQNIQKPILDFIEILIYDWTCILIHFPSLFTINNNDNQYFSIWNCIIDFFDSNYHLNFWNFIFDFFINNNHQIPSLHHFLTFIHSKYIEMNQSDEMFDSQDFFNLENENNKNNHEKEKENNENMDDLIEIIWLIIFHTVSFSKKLKDKNNHHHHHHLESFWNIIQKLIEKSSCLLSLQCIKQYQSLFKSFPSFVDEEGNIRNWLLSINDKKYIKQLLLRLVELSNKIQCNLSSSIILLFFEHFRVVYFYDKSICFPSFLRDHDKINKKLKSNENDEIFCLFLKFLYNHFYDIHKDNNLLSSNHILKLSSKYFGKLLTKQQQYQILKDGENIYHSLYYLSPLRNSISLLLTFSIFFPSNSISLSSLMSRMLGLFDYKQQNQFLSSQPYQIVMEGIYMLALIKQNSFSQSKENITKEKIKLLINNKSLTTKSLSNELEEFYQIILLKSIYPITELIINRIKDLNLSNSSSICFEKILFFSIQCIQLFYDRMIKLNGKIISAHSFLLSPLLYYQLNSSISLHQKYFSCKLISTAFSSLIVQFQNDNNNNTMNDNDMIDDDDEILKIVQFHEQKNQFQMNQLLSGFLLCKILEENGCNKQLFNLLSSSTNNNNSHHDNLNNLKLQKFLAQLSRSIGELAACFSFYNLEKWGYFIGRFGSSSKWIEPSAPSSYREIPARIFANSIVYYHKLIQSFKNDNNNNSPLLNEILPNYKLSLDEIEIIRLWIFLMIEPKYSMLQGLFTHAIIRKFSEIHQSPENIKKLFPLHLLTLCESHQMIFQHRKQILYKFLENVNDLLLPNSKTIPNMEDLTKFYNIFSSIPKRFCFIILKELPLQLLNQTPEILLSQTKFCFSIIGHLLSTCTFLLYRPKFPNCLLSSIISLFFRTNSFDFKYRLNYLPKVLEGFGNLSEIYSISSDPFLQRELKQLFDFYWDILHKSNNEQQNRMIIHSWSFIFSQYNFCKLRKYLLHEILLPKLLHIEETSKLILLLNFITQILFFSSSFDNIIDDICIISTKFIELMIINNNISFSERICFYNSWSKILNIIRCNELDYVNPVNSLLNNVYSSTCLPLSEIVEIFILLLINDLTRLIRLKSNIQFNSSFLFNGFKK